MIEFERHPLEGGPRGPDVEAVEDVVGDITSIIEAISNGTLPLLIPDLEGKGWRLNGPFWDFILGRNDGSGPA
jgi:hypothetical protein